MSLTVTAKNSAADTAVLHVKGMLNAEAAPDFDAVIMPYAENPAIACLILEGSELAYVASAGLRVLLKAVKAMTGRKALFFGVGLSAQVVSVLRITGFLSFINLRDNIDACKR